MVFQRPSLACVLGLVASALYPIAHAQPPVSVGIRGGIHLIDWFKAPDAGPSATGTDESSRATVGPLVGLRLPRGLELQSEGLWRGYGFTRSSGRVGFFTSHEESGSSWEIPALLVWHIPYEESGWQPYIGAGPAVRYISANFVDITRRPQVLPTDPPAMETRTTADRNEWRGGVMGTAGMEKRIGHIGISVEFRYAYWSASTLIGDIVPNHSQISLLVGIRSR